MRSTLLASCLLLLAGLATAQVQVRVFAQTILTVVDQSIPANTDISAGASLAWSNNHPTFRTNATMLLTVTGGMVRFRNFVFGTGALPPPIYPHSIRVNLASPAPVTGTLRVEGSADLVNCLFQADVRNDGSLELDSTPTLMTSAVYEEALTVPSGGLDVVLTGAAGAGFTSFQGNSSLTLSFSPAGTKVSIAGTPCGAELAGRYSAVLFPPGGARYELAAQNAPVTPHAFFVFGTTPQSIVIPPLNCQLRTDMLVPLHTVVDANGRARMTLPAPALGATVLVQFLAATLDAQQNPIWRTSELVRLHL